MIPAGTSSLDYIDEWGVFYNGFIVGIRDDAPEEVKKQYAIDSEIIAKATETMFKE